MGKIRAALRRPSSTKLDGREGRSSATLSTKLDLGAQRVSVRAMTKRWIWLVPS